MKWFQDYTLAWWQIGLLKIAMIAFGLAAGASWPGAFQGWLLWLWAVFILLSAYLVAVGIRQWK